VAEDVDAVRRLLIRTWHATYDAIMGAEAVTTITNTWHAPDRLRAQCCAPDAMFLVAEATAELVAMASARHAENMLQLDRLYVDSSSQRQGSR